MLENNQKLMNYAIEKVYGREDLTEDQKQEILLNCMEYLNKTEKTIVQYFNKLVNQKPKKECDILYIEDLNLSYNIGINDEKALLQYVIQEIKKQNRPAYLRVLKIVIEHNIIGKTIAEIAEEQNRSRNRISQLNFKGLCLFKRILSYEATMGTKYEAHTEKKLKEHRERVKNKQMKMEDLFISNTKPIFESLLELCNKYF